MVETTKEFKEFDEHYFKGDKGSSYKDYHEIGKNVYDITIKFLKKFIKYEKINPQDLDILVVGCAYGYECKACKDIGFKRVVGIDISEHAIAEARRTFPSIEFYIGDVCNLNFKDNEFDIIMANNLLEHLPDPRVALKEFHRISRKYVLLRQDNVFMIEIFNSLPIFLRKIIHKLNNLPAELDTDLTHISQLPRYKWIQLFKYYNFRVKKVFFNNKISDTYSRVSSLHFGGNKMKVAILTRYFLPVKAGIENHCYNLAKELLKREIDVEIHTSKDTLTESNILKEFEIIDDIKVYRHKNFWRFIPKDCDIIHLHNFNVFPHLWIFLKIFFRKLFHIKSSKLVITLHAGFTPRWEEFSFIFRILKKLYHKTLGRFFLNYVVDSIIAVSEWEKEQLIKEGIKKEKIVVIPNGVENLAYILPKKKYKELDKYYPYLLFIGRISKRKNLDTIIKWLKNFDKITLLIAGQIHEKDYYQYLIKLAKKLGMSNRIIFLGEIKGEEKYKLIDNCLAVVLLSYHEAESITTKEAMARGKPVIVSNKSALPYIVKNGENGFVVSNEREFVEAIGKIMKDKELLKEIAKNNKSLSRKWKWDYIANKIITIYLQS